MHGLPLKNTLFWSVLGAALALRLWGISFGLIHADEPIIVNHAMAYGAGDLHPHFFKIPPLVSYIVFGLYAGSFVILRSMGMVQNAEAFALQFFSDPQPFYVGARVMMGALLGTATVAWVYREASKLFSERAAMLGALFLAVNFLHVRESHYIYVDIPMVLAVCAVMSAARKIYMSGDVAVYRLAGGLIGLAAAIKYNAAISCVAVVTAHLLSKKKDLKPLLGSAAVSIAVFFILNPFALLDPGFFWNELRTQGGAEGWVGFAHVAGYSLWHGAGAGALALAVAGIIFFLRMDRPLAILYMAFPLTYFLVLVFFSQPHERYVLPLIPFVCLWAGLASDRFLAMRWPYPAKILVYGVILLALIVPTYQSARVCRLLEKPDIREEMKTWIEAYIPQGSSIAFDHSFWRPRLERDAAQWAELLTREDLTEMARKKNTFESKAARQPGYELFFMYEGGPHKFSSVWPIVGYDADELRRAGVQYIVLHTEHQDPHAVFKKEISDSATLVAAFSPFGDPTQRLSSDPHAVTCAPFTWQDIHQRKRNGPLLELYEMKG